jgi:hypothetical protein
VTWIVNVGKQINGKNGLGRFASKEEAKCFWYAAQLWRLSSGDVFGDVAKTASLLRQPSAGAPGVADLDKGRWPAPVMAATN